MSWLDELGVPLKVESHCDEMEELRDCDGLQTVLAKGSEQCDKQHFPSTNARPSTVGSLRRQVDRSFSIRWRHCRPVLIAILIASPKPPDFPFLTCPRVLGRASPVSCLD